MLIPNLIKQAYQQYECFKAEVPWTTEGLVAVLSAKPKGLFQQLRPYGFIANIENQTYVVFRGTDSFADWLVNADFDQVKHPLGVVHDGAYHLYRQMQIPRLDNPIIVGHSLGCWMATYAAVDQTNPTVRLYAAPRAGDVEFAKNYNKLIPDTLRIVNTEDIVPTLPPPGNWCHIGKAQCFTVGGGTVTERHSMETYSQ